MPVVATAGHVDHGKSTLIRALTGIDPDRWQEEKDRGLTIDLGFAWCTLPSGADVSFVDVPGHARFISNMLAGVGGIDGCLFVIDTTEGWRQQSEEHFRILDVLGVERGVIALTKVGLVDGDTAELVALDVADRVAGTFLASAPVIPVDVVAGIGIDAMRDALDHLVTTAPPALDRHRPRLWIDRAFAARGAGTVVTGTLTGGAIAVHDELVVEPLGARVRVRGLQSHQQSLDTATPGRRVAVNLTGIAHHDVERGNALVRGDQWARSAMFDCTLTVVPSVGHDVTRRGAYHAHIGAGEYAARVRVLAADAIAPGSIGAVRLHIPVALPLVRGDRYVLRESGRGETVGGGEILDVAPVSPASRARPDRSIERIIAERGWVDAGELERLTSEARPPTVGRWVVADEALAEATARLRAALDAGDIDTSRLDERDVAVLGTIDGVATDGGRARWASAPARDWTSHPFLGALHAAAFSPPEPNGVDRQELRELVRHGLVVERDGVYFAASAIDEAARVIAELLEKQPDGVTVGNVRDALGATRKHTVPLLAHLDATGVTRRRGDLRVAGPRLPQALE